MQMEMPLIVFKEVGTIDYEKGEIIFGPLNITSKLLPGECY